MRHDGRTPSSRSCAFALNTVPVTFLAAMVFTAESLSLSLSFSGKLKLKCGSQFTSKMEGMMNDLAIGGDHEAAFGKYLKDGQESGKIDVEKIDFNVQVCSTWVRCVFVRVVVDRLQRSCVCAVFCWCVGLRRGHSSSGSVRKYTSR